MKHLLLRLSLIASTGYADSKTDTTIVPKKAGGSDIVGTSGTNRITVNSAGATTVTGTLTPSGGISGYFGQTGMPGEVIGTSNRVGVDVGPSTTWMNIGTLSIPPGRWFIYYNLISANINEAVTSATRLYDGSSAIIEPWPADGPNSIQIVYDCVGSTKTISLQTKAINNANDAFRIRDKWTFQAIRLAP